MSNGLAGQLLSPVKSLEAVKTRLTEALLARHSFSHPALAAEFGGCSIPAIRTLAPWRRSQ